MPCNRYAHKRHSQNPSSSNPIRHRDPYLLDGRRRNCPERLRPLAQQLADAKDALLSLLFPPRCAGCGALCANSQPFCPLCATTLLPITPPFCPRCFRPYTRGACRVCPQCMADPPPYIRAVAVFQYGGELAQAIYQLKYRNQLFLARPLGTLMAGHLHALAPDLVVPVPLHRRRLNQRGYNQAAELAKFAARKIAIPVAPTLAVRVHDTPAQVSLSLSQRKTLNADSFSVKKKKKLKGKHIVVLDDVYTTGTTTRAVTRALLRDGARAVSVLTLAKSVH